MESISLLVQSPLFLQLSGPIVVITLVGLFWWRAGSIHSVFDRLWRLVAGKAEVQDPVLKAFMQKNRDVEQFRFTFGLKVETQADLHRLLAWIEGNAFDIARLQKVRRWIDTRSEHVVAGPPKSYFIGKLLVILACAVGVFAASTALSSQSAWLQMRKSGIWFSTNGTSVHDVFDRWSFDATVCEKDASHLMRLTGFLESEVAASCSALTDGSLTRIVTQTVEKQRMIGAAVDGIAIVLLITSIFGISAAAEARRMRSQLDARANELLSSGASDPSGYKLGLAHYAPSHDLAPPAESAASSAVELDSRARTRGAPAQEAP